MEELTFEQALQVCRAENVRSDLYRATSLIQNCHSLGPYSRHIRRALRWSQGGGGALSYERGTPVVHRVDPNNMVCKGAAWRGSVGAVSGEGWAVWRQFGNLKHVYRTPRPYSGRGILKRCEFPRDRLHSEIWQVERRVACLHGGREQGFRN